jgi:hypothetical protein
VIVHIGYYKTGSSWLQKHFFSGDPRTGLRTIGKVGADHPARRLVRVRPFEFDAATCRAWFEPLLEPVKADGLMPVVSFERLAGHPCSGGYDGKEIAHRLKEVFPEARILIVIREQRSIIVSTYKQYVKGGGPGTLRQFLEPPTSTSMRVPGFDFRHFEYEHLLRHYRSLFGPEIVLTLAFEQFVREPADFVAEIGRFAGLPVSGELLDSLPFEARVNPAFSAAKTEVRRRRNRLVRSELNPAPLLESRPLKRLTRFTESTGFEALVPDRLAARKEASLRRAVAEIVGDRYAESNRATAELTGIDLGGYGWTV